jgi:isochorismate synthase
MNTYSALKKAHEDIGMLFSYENEQLIRHLIHHDISFALYYSPLDKKFHLVMQNDLEAPFQSTSIADLRNQKGFVIAPFSTSAENPIVCIRPDIVAHGAKQIIKAVKAMESKNLSKEVTSKQNVTPEPDVTPDSDVTPETYVTPTQREYKAAYAQAFERFMQPLREGTFSKLVLSRSETRRVEFVFIFIPIFIATVLDRLDSMSYLCHTPATGTWMGSTPEILLNGKGKKLATMALAGTQDYDKIKNLIPEGKDVKDIPVESLWDKKNLQEQELVSEYIRQVLQRHASQVNETAPRTRVTDLLCHIQTDFSFTLNAHEHICELLEDLHPTPAVCGLPKEEARQFILANEGYDRRYYTGFLGWFDPEGETSLYVNLRCLHYDRILKQSTVYAGGGLLPTSSRTKEWEETRKKMELQREISITFSRKKK